MKNLSSHNGMYEILRRLVEHEDNLVIQRLNWLLVAQGFLFVAYAQVLTSDKLHNRLVPLLIICIFSMCVTIFTLIGLFAAFNALRNINEMIENPFIMKEEASGSGKDAHEPEIKLTSKQRGKSVAYEGVTFRWVGNWYASGKISAIGIAGSLLFAWILLLAWSVFSI